MRWDVSYFVCLFLGFFVGWLVWLFVCLFVCLFLFFVVLLLFLLIFFCFCFPYIVTTLMVRCLVSIILLIYLLNQKSCVKVGIFSHKLRNSRCNNGFCNNWLAWEVTWPLCASNSLICFVLFLCRYIPSHGFSIESSRSASNNINHHYNRLSKILHHPH